MVKLVFGNMDTKEGILFIYCYRLILVLLLIVLYLV